MMASSTSPEPTATGMSHRFPIELFLKSDATYLGHTNVFIRLPLENITLDDFFDLVKQVVSGGFFRSDISQMQPREVMVRENKHLELADGGTLPEGHATAIRDDTELLRSLTSIVDGEPRTHLAVFIS
jgi:hypothetical protein